MNPVRKILIAAGFCTCVQFAQTGTRQHPVRTLDIPLALQSELVIEVPETASHWGVGVKIVAGEAHLQAAEFRLATRGNGVQGVQSVAALAKSCVQTGNSVQFASSCFSAGDQSLVVYVETPKPVTISLRKGSQLLARTRVIDGIVWKDGAVVAEPVRGIASVVAAVVMPSGLPSGNPALATSKARLLRYTELPELVTAQSRSAQLKIRVDADGNVTDVTAGPGGEEILAATRATILSWKFRPATEPTTIDLPIFVRGGKLLHPLSPSATLN